MEKVKTDYYEKLYEVTSILNSERAPEALLHSIVKSVAQALEAKACSLMLLTPDRETLLHTVSYGLSDWYYRKGPVKVSKVISDTLKGKPVTVLHASQDERVLYREQARKEGIESILSVPMRLRGEVIGVVRVYTAKPYYFTNDDIRFVETVANLSAIALENLRAYEMIQKDYETFREEMLRWRAELGYEWIMGESVELSEEKLQTIEPG